ncbi:lysosomal proton-coupled steroid conjugate and bile acid symporter SLC46A3-like [Ylistrum balloti]|uniref:lysosomal proton-coupled steroid conjugate and bile acid symporter SLC46A3-like n=1 Tax=Ylistrum balloti TaxID=509963 RepID=UPI002905BD34|nr:lysosomal proton-coupled steroid conjugate and bile acid symporter SLC46A3-like [Ylistrum balloti]
MDGILLLLLVLFFYDNRFTSVDQVLDKMDEDDESPLLPPQQYIVNTDSGVEANGETKSERTCKSSLRWGHYLMGPCLTIHLYSFLYSNMVIEQYVYSYLGKQKYPDSSFLNNNGDSQCNTNKTSQAYIERTDVQKMTSDWLILSSLFACMPAILTDVVMGSFSDRYGRKLFVIISLIGTFLKTVLIAMGMSTAISLNYFFLFVGIEGLTGGWCLVLSLGYAYVSDLSSTDKTRTFGFTLVEISVGFGLVFSGVTSGYLIKDVGFVYSMIVISTLNALNLITVLLFLPESLQHSMRSTTNILNLMKNAFTFYTHDTSSEGKRWKYIVLSLGYVAYTMSIVGRQSVEELYQLNVPFCWNSILIGWYSSINDVVRNVIGLSSIKLFQRCLPDEIIVIVSVMSSIVSYVTEALAVNDVMLMFVPILGIFCYLCSPVIRSILSKMTPPDRQGALFSGTAVIQSVCTVAAEVSSKSIYTATVSSFRGFVFLEFGGYSVIMLILFICFMVVSKMTTKGNITTN